MHSWPACANGNGRHCALTLVAPDNEKFTVQSAPARLPRRKPNARPIPPQKYLSVSGSWTAYSRGFLKVGASGFLGH